MSKSKFKTLMSGLKEIEKRLHSVNLLEGNLSPSDATSQVVTFDFEQYKYSISFLHAAYFMSTYFTHRQFSALIEDFSHYVTLPSEILGKKSSKIILSKSRLYCLKLIEEGDLQKIQTILPQLFKRKTNQDCMMPIYSIFLIDSSIKGLKVTDRYILMPNLRGSFDNCLKSFDIKGHLQCRVIGPEDSRDFKFGKDQNFIESSQLKLLIEALPNSKRKRILEGVSENVRFLEERNIIDYSLLISIEKTQKTRTLQSNSCLQAFCNGNQLKEKIEGQVKVEREEQNQKAKQSFSHQFFYWEKELLIVKWAIIDYFQEYNDKKKMENKFRSFFGRTGSSIGPKEYAERLLGFLRKNLAL